MLKLSTQSNENKNTAEIKKALGKYLSEARHVTFFSKHKELKKDSKEFAEKFVTSSNYSRKEATDILFENPQETIKIIDEQEKEFAKQAKGYSLKEKINYALDARADDSSESPYGAAVDKLPSIVAASVVGAVVATALQDAGATAEAELAFLGTIAVIPAVTMVKKSIQNLTNPKTSSEKISSSQYIELKHTQVALKQMKKALRSEMKADEKSEYKQMVAECFAKTAPGVIGFLGKNGGR